MLRNMLNSFSGLSVGKSISSDRGRESMARDATTKKDVSIIAARNRRSSPLLRLPAELRNQIYTHLDLGDHTIEILHASQDQVFILDERGEWTRSASVKTWKRLFFRIELDRDEKFAMMPSRKISFAPSRMSIRSRVKRFRCASVQGLFPFVQVCRQLRGETMLLLYQKNSFAFTDTNFNACEALRSWVESLSLREQTAIHSICWPYRQAREYQRTFNGIPLGTGDRDCSAEFGKLSGISNVILRWAPVDIGNAPLSENETTEFLRDYAQSGDRGYIVEREFRRSLTERGMQRQVNRADVYITCNRTWRAAF